MLSNIPNVVQCGGIDRPSLFNCSRGTYEQVFAALPHIKDNTTMIIDNFVIYRAPALYKLYQAASPLLQDYIIPFVYIDGVCIIPRCSQCRGALPPFIRDELSRLPFTEVVFRDYLRTPCISFVSE